MKPSRLYDDQASGKKDDRPGLEACLKSLREGDTLTFWKLDRLGRNLRHLVNTIHDLMDRKIGFWVLSGQGGDTRVGDLCNELGVTRQTLCRFIDPQGGLRADKTEPRHSPENVKEQIVRERGFLNQRLEREQVAEFDYRPGKCKKSYRMVVLRKNLSIERGERVLFDEIRYFFYITNRRDLGWDEVVRDANERCNQENVIEKLKNGVNVMRMPVQDLESNWAYMVMAALAWNLKAWFGLMVPDRSGA